MTSFKSERKNLVDGLIQRGYLYTEAVINAMLEVPREIFVPSGHENHAYVDSPLGTCEGQTISAPHMNAMMCEYLDLSPGLNVLEIGTGSGYHAALCAYIVAKPDKNGIKGHVYTIERIDKLVEFAKKNLLKAGYHNDVNVILGDGTIGFAEKSPYDRILVTAAGPKIPEPIIAQLKMGGKICIPIGREHSSQDLIVGLKTENSLEIEYKCGVIFVPLIGKHGF
jgi:protein-L-isoaspartate(D-aspartate) O-methyltransferase